jgi:hypothetical protein
MRRISGGPYRCAVMRMRRLPNALLCVLLLAGVGEAATITVNEGDDLQAALNAARPGDEVVLQAGARFVGAFRLPAVKGPVRPITIRSSAVLPLRRITPADAALLPIIASGSGGTALTGEGVSNWRLDGIRKFITPSTRRPTSCSRVYRAFSCAEECRVITHGADFVAAVGFCTVGFWRLR